MKYCGWSDRMKSKIGYKLFRVKKSCPGVLFPLYVNANKPVPIGKWIDAECGEVLEDGKVKSKLGGLKFRPGWHINDQVPHVVHIGIKEDGRIAYMRNNVVWCEVEYCTEIDYCQHAKENGMRNGKIDLKKACLDKIPENGFYYYKTSPQMFGKWIIAGKMKVRRVLQDTEVNQICKEYGVVPLPRKERMDLSQYGFVA